MGLPEKELKVKPSTQAELSQWLLHMWKHPLLDETTIRHRLKANDGFNNMMDFIIQRDVTGLINPQSVVAGRMMGGDLWFANADSDHDVWIYGSDKDIADQLKSNWWSLRKDFLREKFGIDIVGVKSIDDRDNLLHLARSGLAISMLVTPDSLLLGNTHLAQAARLKLVDQIDLLEPSMIFDIWDSTDSKLQKHFKEYFKNWAFAPTRGGEERKAAKKREFEQRLQVVAVRKHIDPGQYTEQFYKLIARFKLPDFEIYRDVMRQTEGKLELA